MMLHQLTQAQRPVVELRVQRGVETMQLMCALMQRRRLITPHY